MPTIAEVRAEIAALQVSLTASRWTPTAPEQAAARETLLSSVEIDVSSTEAITRGLKSAGPQVSPKDGSGRLFAVMALCASVLRQPSLAESEDGQELDRELRALLYVIDDRAPRRHVLGRFRRSAPASE